MAFVAPLIAGALGVGAIGEAVIGVGLAVAAGLVSRALAPKPSTSSNGGMRLSLRTEANGPRELVVGRAATAGSLRYHQVWGPNGNDNLQLVFQLADHECDALETVIINGAAVTWNSGTGAVTEFPGMSITFHSGAAGQTADADLVAHGGGRWTTADKGTGLCYVVVQMAYDQKLYTTGLPRFLFVIRGAKLYDIRLDSTAGGSGSHRWGVPSTYAWTDNPAVIAYNYARGIWIGSQRMIGMAAPAAALPATVWIAEANICDEAVSLAAGGTEKRYRANGVISSASTHRQVFSDLTTACAGLCIEAAGALKMRAGAGRSAVATITDDDLIEGAEIEIQPKRPRSELVNAVFGSFADPAQQYEMNALPPRLSPSDETTDGGVRLEQHYPLDLVTSATQGQRILEIMRRRARHQLQVQIRLPAAFCAIEAGDWISWTSTRYGWSSQNFEVVVATVEDDKTVALALREISTAVYAWTTGDQLDPASPGALPSGGPTLSSVSGLGVSVVTVSNGTSASRPGIGATWTAITDPTVHSIRFQYRRAGDTTALEVECLTPGASNYVWINSVQGETAYEVRALPVCHPDRATNWTAWLTTTSTSQQVVAVANVATIANAVPADTITPEMLSAQTRFELNLATALDTLQGSSAAALSSTLEWAQQAADAAIVGMLDAFQARTDIRIEQAQRHTEDEALAQLITTVQAATTDNAARITDEITARTTADEAQASQLTTLTSQVDGHTSSIATMSTAIGGYAAKWSLSLSVDGYVAGAVTLDGTASGATFGVLAANFVVAQPGVAGGDPMQPFSIGLINGVSAIGMRGDVIVDGTIEARHMSVVSLDAISATFGALEAGTITSPDGKLYISSVSGAAEIRISS